MADTGIPVDTRRLMYCKLQRRKWRDVLAMLATGEMVITVEGDARFVLMTIDQREAIASAVKARQLEKARSYDPNRIYRPGERIRVATHDSPNDVIIVPELDADGNPIPW